MEFERITTDRRIIAHAGGGSVHGSYPNAIEVMDWWYEQGVRHFEFDLQWTCDGALASLHDWGPTLQRWFDLSTLPWYWKLLSPAIRLTGLPEAVFHRLPMVGQLTVITPERLKTWLDTHPDAWLVTDIKRHNARALRVLAETLGNRTGRVLAQVFAIEEIALARKLGYGAVGWANYVPKVPVEKLPDLLAGHNLDVIVVNVKTIRDPATHPILQTLRAQGPDLWVFTVNDPGRENALPSSVNGIITDRLLPKPAR